MLSLTVACLVWGARFEDIEELDIGGAGQEVTLVSIDGVRYRKTEPGELLSPALDGQAVCVEGKFGGTALRKDVFAFSMLGTDTEFVYANATLVADVLRGDNILVGGQAVLYKSGRRKNTCSSQ